MSVKSRQLRPSEVRKKSKNQKMKIFATFGLSMLLAVIAHAQTPDQFVAQIYRYHQGEKSEI